MLFRSTELDPSQFFQANVKVRSQNGPVHHLTVFVDSCAQTNILNLQAMHQLFIKAIEAPDRIIVVKQKNAMPTHGWRTLTTLLKSGNNFKIRLIKENNTDHEHPNTQIAATYLRKVSNYEKRDPAFDKQIAIDHLIGQSVYTHCEVTERQRTNYIANRHDPWLYSLRCC